MRLGSTPYEVSPNDVASALGHSNGAMRSGVTAQYVDERSENLWGQRVDAQYEDTFGSPVTPATPENRKNEASTTNSKGILEQAYKDAGIDISAQNVESFKGSIRRQMQKEHEKACMSQSGSALQPKSTNQIIGGGKHKAMVDDNDERPHSKMVHSQSRLELYGPEGSGLDNVDSIPFMEEDDDPESRIDPPILEMTNSLERVFAGDKDEDDTEADTDIQEIFISQLGTVLRVPSALQLPGLEYVKFLTRVNVITRSVGGQADNPVVPDYFYGNRRA